MNGAKLDQAAFPHGVCPFMSGIPIPREGGIIPGDSRTITISPLMVPCLGPSCQLWRQVSEAGSTLGYCSFSQCGDWLRDIADNVMHVFDGVSRVADGTSNLEPPKSGPSPISRIAESLEALVSAKAKAGK